MLLHVRRPLRVALALSGLGVLAGVLGGSCTGLSVDLPLLSGGSIQFNTVQVELWNQTGFPVNPRLFVDPEDDSLNGDADENYYPVSPPVDPGEIATLTLTCAEAGALETDHAVKLGFLDNDESDNDPIARRHDDFDCGDTVTFIFVDDHDDDFHTRVAVNGEIIED